MNENSPHLSMLDFLLILAGWKKSILLSFFTVCLVTALIGFNLPKWYRASCTILGPTTDLTDMGLSAIAGNLNLGSFGLLGTNKEFLRYVAILESRTVNQRIADAFDLQKVYKTTNWEKTLKALAGNVDVEINKEGTITISVLDRDPQRAADMANAFAHYLDSLNTRLKVEKARNTRLFIEKRYNQNKADLAVLADSLKRFQQKHGIIALPAQLEAEIKSIAELQAQYVAVDMEMGVQSKYFSPDHEVMVKLKNQLSEIGKKLSDMAGRGPGDPGKDKALGHDGKFFIPLDSIPDVATRYAHLFREITVQTEIYKLLTTQYETAKIQESRDTPTVQILDPAIAPIRKAWPRVSILVLVAGTLTLLTVMTLALMREVVARHHALGTPTGRKLSEIRRALGRKAKK